MDDNFTEKEIQSTLTYLKHHDLENANRLFAIEFLRALQEMTRRLADEDISQAELLHKTLQAKKKEKSAKDEETEEDEDDAETEESEEPKTKESEKP